MEKDPKHPSQKKVGSGGRAMERVRQFTESRGLSDSAPEDVRNTGSGKKGRKRRKAKAR